MELQGPNRTPATTHPQLRAYAWPIRRHHPEAPNPRVAGSSEPSQSARHARRQPFGHPGIPNALVATASTPSRRAKPTLEGDNSASHAAEGERGEASANIRGALDKIEAALRAGYNGLAAIVGDSLLPTGISEATRLATFTTYGWEKGQLGRLTDTRILMLAELALHGETAVTNPAWRYSPAIVSLIGTQLGIIEDEDPDATAGGRQTSVADRLASLDLLHTRISRARYHYCAASDELDSTKELAKISFQPRRPANGASTSVPAVTPPAPTP